MPQSRKLESIVAALKRHEAGLRTTCGIKRIGVFGSIVRNEWHEESDLDLLVEFEDDVEIGLLEFVRIESYLGSLLGVKVDLVERSALKPLIGKQVAREVVYP
jgi:uncharacterized protein